MAHKIVVLTAPSGSGKSTIAAQVMAAFPALRFSVSATTRPRRAHEVDGTHYHFITEATFREKIAAGEMLEYEAFYGGTLYGTLRAEVDRIRKTNPVLLDIEVKGAENVKRIFGDEAFVLFIRPPSLEALRHRLERRGTENKETLQQRLERAAFELTYAERFDAVVVNDDLEVAVAEAIQQVGRFLGGDPA